MTGLRGRRLHKGHVSLPCRRGRYLGKIRRASQVIFLGHSPEASTDPLGSRRLRSTPQRSCEASHILDRFWPRVSCLLRVKNGSAALEMRLPLYRHERTLLQQPSCPLSANSGLMQRSKVSCHSITSSALASNVGGMFRPSAFATLRLITSFKRVGCSTGRSAGFAPFKILST
jgi:hypothetical protein